MRTFWRLVPALAFAVILIVVVAALLFLQNHPLVEKVAAPSPEDVVVARTFVRDLRVAAGGGTKAGRRLSLSEAEANSIARLGARMIPGLRVRLRLGEHDVLGEVSIPVPGTNGGLWLNAAVSVPAFDGALSFDRVRVGSLAVPPGLALELGRAGGDLILGNGFGTTVTTIASAMDIRDGRLDVTLAMDLQEMGKNGLMRGVFGALRGSEMPAPEEIDRYYLMIREAMDRGDLPTEGSYLPYVRFALRAALEGSRTEGVENAYTAALFALARACVGPEFTSVVGRLGGDIAGTERDWRTDCSELTLNGRTDSRKHFTAAAAIQAASNRGFSVSIGEFKELYDTVKAGGFDFTDIAADNSGIRMSNRFMAAPAEAWPGLLDRLQSEGDVIVSYDGIPAIMSRAEFDARFGSVESPAYRAMLADIEARIDGLALHSPD